MGDSREQMDSAVTRAKVQLDQLKQHLRKVLSSAQELDQPLREGRPYPDLRETSLEAKAVRIDSGLSTKSTGTEPDVHTDLSGFLRDAGRAYELQENPDQIDDAIAKAERSVLDSLHRLHSIILSLDNIDTQVSYFEKLTEINFETNDIEIKVEEIKNSGNKLLPDHVELYRENMHKIDKLSMDAIKDITEISSYHEVLNHLLTRAEQAEINALNGIDRNRPEQERPKRRNESARLFDEAYNAIMDAVQACGTRGDSKQIEDAIIKAKKMVYQVEMNMLKYCNSQDHKTLSDLEFKFEATEEAIKVNINDNKYVLTRNELGKFQAMFESWRLTTHDFILEAAKICADQEKSGQRDEAIKGAQMRVRSLEVFPYRARYDSIRQRIKPIQEWYQSMANSHTVESSVPKLLVNPPQPKINFGEYIDGSSDFSKLDTQLETYSEECRRMEEAGIRYFINTNVDKNVKRSIESLMDRADNAYQQLVSSDQLMQDQQEEVYRLYNVAYNAIVNDVMAFSRRRAANQEVVSGQEGDRQTHEMLAEAEKQIRYLEHKVTKVKILAWQEWFDKTVNSLQHTDKSSFFRDLYTISSEANKIEQQIIEAKSGDDSSLLEHIKSYEEKEREIGKLALDVIKHIPEEDIPEISSYHEVLNHLLTQAKETQEAVLNEINRKDDLPEQEMQTLRNDSARLFGKAYDAVMDAVKARGTREASEQIDFAITRARNEILQVKMTILKPGNLEDYQTLSGLLTTADEAVKGIIHKINDDKYSKQEEKQKLLAKFSTSYKAVHDAVVQAVESCTKFGRCGAEIRCYRKSLAAC